MTASLSDGIETVIDIFILSANAPLSDQLDTQLREEGYYITLFSDAAHLLETLRNGKPNLLMCDATVPAADAFEVCRQIKADDYLWNIPVLVITGASDLKDLLSVLDCNADNFIAYPFDPAYLLSLVEGTLTIPVERPTPDQIKTQFKIKHDDQVFVVTADRRKLLEFLLSSFEIAVNKSSELARTADDNRNLGITIRNLEDTVQENRKVIGIINENLKSREQSVAELTTTLADRENTLQEKIASLGQLMADLSSEKTAGENTRKDLRRVEQEKAEAIAAYKATIDQLQRQVSDLSSELGTLKPELERTRSELARESAVRKEIEETLGTTTAEKEQAERALGAAQTELGQLNVDLGTERNRAQEAEQELKAVLEAKTQSEQDLTAIINDLKETAKEQAAAISRMKEELESEHSRLRQTEENLQAVAAAKEQSEASLKETLEETIRTGKSDLADLQARSEASQKAAEQELASVSGMLAETKAALDTATRALASRNEDLARISQEKETAETLAESHNESIRGLQKHVEQEKDRFREYEARMNGVIQEKENRISTLSQEHDRRIENLRAEYNHEIENLRTEHTREIENLRTEHTREIENLRTEYNREIGNLRVEHDDTRTALSSHQSSMEQMKHDLDSAVSARAVLEQNLQKAEEKARQVGLELEDTLQTREQEKQKLSAISETLERVKTSLEQETLRRQEAEDQLRDALAQQQHLEQDVERLVAETRTLNASLNAERKTSEESRVQVQSLEGQVASLNREKREAEEAAAHLSHEIDQARVALADEWEDHMTDNERRTEAFTPKPAPPRPAPFPGVKKEAEIIKKRSLIVKTPIIPTEIRPLPRSMVAIDPVKPSEFDTPPIKSVEDLYEDDEGDVRKPPASPVVSIIQEPATEPVRDVLPDTMVDTSGTADSFFEENGQDRTPEIGEDAEDSDSDLPQTGQSFTLDRTQWLDLLKWSHHCEELTQDQRMHIVRLGRLIQKGRRLTKNQEEQVSEMLALVQRLGYRIP